MTWARTPGVERGNGGPRWGAWEVGVGGTRGGGGWARGRAGGPGGMGEGWVCGIREGDEKPRVCGVVEGDDESWPESDLLISAGSKNTNSMKTRAPKGPVPGEHKDMI